MVESAAKIRRVVIEQEYDKNFRLDLKFFLRLSVIYAGIFMTKKLFLILSI